MIDFMELKELQKTIQNVTAWQKEVAPVVNAGVKELAQASVNAAGYSKTLMSAVSLSLQSYDFHELSRIYNNAVRTYTSPMVQDAIKVASSISMPEYKSMLTEATQVAKMLRALLSEDLLAQVKAIASSISAIDTEFIVNAGDYAVLDEVDFSDDNSLIPDGKSYSEEELNQELREQIELVKKEKQPLREKFEHLKQKLWLVLLVLQIVLTIPDIPQKIQFYRDLISTASEIQEEASIICFTIKERAYLRESAASDAPKIIVLPYDTALEIVKDIPRWYQVKYVDENGVEYIGWISKISVETGE